MRIAYDHQVFQWQTYGGVSRYFFELASRLPAIAGDRTTVIAPLHVNGYLPDLPGARGLRTPALPRTARLRGLANRVLTPLLLRSFAPDIVHETYFSATPTWRGSGDGRRSVQTVLTVFDMIHEKFPADFPPRDRTSRDKRLAVARADHVLCISRSTQRDLVDLFGVDEAKTSVTHLGFSVAPRRAQPLAPTGRDPLLLYVGQRRGYKNFAGFLRAYAASPRLRRDCRVLAFGGGPFSPSEHALRRDLGLTDAQVRQTGGPDALLADLYGRAAALVYPSLYEGFGLPLLEAMANGCPVACARASSIPEVAGEAAEYFDPLSVEDMTQALERVLYADERRHALAALGQRRAAQFTWDACARRTREIYARLRQEQGGSLST